MVIVTVCSHQLCLPSGHCTHAYTQSTLPSHPLTRAATPSLLPLCRRQSNSFELGNTGTQRQRHLRYLRHVHSANSRLTLSSEFSSREGDAAAAKAYNEAGGAANRKKTPTKVGTDT